MENYPKTDISAILKSQYGILSVQPVAHAHLKDPLAGIALTSTWSKLALNTTNFMIDALGGFTFDNANNRFYWDSINSFNMSLLAEFIGDAGLQVTADIGSGVTIDLGLFINNNLILNTPIKFINTANTQSYGANDILIDDTTKLPLLTQGSFVEVFAKSGVGEIPTITLDYFNIIVKGR